MTQPERCAHGCERIVRLIYVFLKYDSVHRQLNGTIAILDQKGKDLLIVSGNRFQLFHEVLYIVSGEQLSLHRFRGRQPRSRTSELLSCDWKSLNPPALAN